MASGGACVSYPKTKRSYSSEFNLMDVDSKTFKNIKRIVKSTWDPDVVGHGQDGRHLVHRRIEVTDIMRICNPKLESKYETYKKYLRRKRSETGQQYDRITGIPQELDHFSRQKLSTDINEFYLFHGTDTENALILAAQGYRVGDPKAMYGRGIYFAERFTKADQYADNKNDRDKRGTELTVLLCKVLLGDFLKCPKRDAQKWKELPYNGRYRYDSVLGSGPGMRFREFVVYDGAQCYPEYIIKYKRVGWKRYPPTVNEWM
uniref:Poly [ADP-ribose] polymerase n=2 Tax=Arion vulgaris TaxID=1028688 RepID=A0A0B7BGU3_9EUPU